MICKPTVRVAGFGLRKIGEGIEETVETGFGWAVVKRTGKVKKVRSPWA